MQCKRFWLDKGEISYSILVQKPEEFARRFTGKLLNPKDHKLACPCCGGRLLTEELEVEQCTRCQGMCFDAEEVDRLKDVLKDVSNYPVEKQDETGYIFLDYRQPLAIWFSAESH